MGVKIVLYMAFNFISSVGLIFANKYIYHHYHYNFATLMTALHFLGKYNCTIRKINDKL